MSFKINHTFVENLVQLCLLWESLLEFKPHTCANITIGREGFIVYFLNVRLCEVDEKNNWNWYFSDETELKQKLELVKVKCIEENFFERVEERAKSYFNRTNVP